MGDGAWGIGHGELGMGNWAWGMGHGEFVVFYLLLEKLLTSNH